jgi:hypothetical protein
VPVRQHVAIRPLAALPWGGKAGIDGRSHGTVM